MSAIPHIGRAEVDRPDGADAASSLYERFSGQIFGYCLHQLGSREEAEDALQTTFMNAFRGLQRGIVPKIESAWLFKIAHNVCLSRRRSTYRRHRIEAPNNLEVLQEIVPAHERNGDELIGLEDVLDKMPEGQRRAILLREWQGLSYREIAGELGLSQSAVETLIFRARRALAQGLEEQPAEPRWRRRARHGLDGGAVLTALKALLTGSTAVKVAATAAVVATTTAVATSETARHHPRPQRTALPSPNRLQPQAPSSAASQSPATARLLVASPRGHAAAPVRHPVASTQRSPSSGRSESPPRTLQATAAPQAKPTAPARNDKPSTSHHLTKPVRSHLHVQHPHGAKPAPKPRPASAQQSDQGNGSAVAAKDHGNAH